MFHGTSRNRSKAPSSKRIDISVEDDNRWSILKEMKGDLMKVGPKMIVSIFCLLAARPAFPLDVSPHRQMVISVTEAWNDSHALLYRFERRDESWAKVGKEMPAVVGKNGLAWDPAVSDRDQGQPVKREGDGRAPAGLFPLSGAMGFSPLPPAG